MRFGLAIMNDFPPGTRPADRVAQLREQVRAASDSGISSVWVLQHYLGSMPTLQPIPLLGALSVDAGDMFLGTNMFILPLRHPVAVAEEYATLDHLTGGRVIAGFGMGYRDNEFAAFGVPLDERVSRYEESLTIIRALWSGEEVRHEGKHFRVDRERISLAPVQPGGPDIWIGAGAHRAGVDRAARLGDGWIMPPHVSPERMRHLMPEYRALLAEQGRLEGHRFVLRRECLLDPDPEKASAEGIGVRARLSNAYGAYNAPDTTEVYRHLKGAESVKAVADDAYLFTDPATCVSKLRDLEAVGVTDVVLRMQWYDLSHERTLASLELFRDEVRPHFAS
jgi:alkanesulfonate monooxygenase SsuD/methylene tetrahydromethanopterin reductase-like flavin-dependent oxidoreductase (luciferase family)